MSLHARLLNGPAARYSTQHAAEQMIVYTYLDTLCFCNLADLRLVEEVKVVLELPPVDPIMIDIKRGGQGQERALCDVGAVTNDQPAFLAQISTVHEGGNALGSDAWAQHAHEESQLLAELRQAPEGRICELRVYACEGTIEKEKSGR